MKDELDKNEDTEETEDPDLEWAKELLEKGQELREEWGKLLRSLRMRGGRFKFIAERSKAYAFAYFSQAIDKNNDFVGELGGSLEEIVESLETSEDEG